MMWESGLSSISTCSWSGGSRLGSDGARGGGGTGGACSGGRKADSIDSSISDTGNKDQYLHCVPLSFNINSYNVHFKLSVYKRGQFPKSRFIPSID